MLFIISTPIGNLKDFTFRAVETLQSCDYVLCEDTRKTKILFDHYNIHKPLVSYHSFNEKKKLQPVIEDLRSGKTIGLVSDAGTPLICDPGSILIEALQEENIPYSVVPGACAFAVALSMIGKPHKKMQFLGFFDEKPKTRTRQIEDAIYYEGVSGFYIAPHDLIKVLKEIKGIKTDSFVFVFRELTKMFEEKKAGPVEEIIAHYTTHPPRGEIVLFIEGTKKENDLSLSERELMDMLINEYHLKLPQAAKLAATLTGKNRKDLYKEYS